ncbi:MAG: hypothetical protein ACYDDS_21385 [Candidatus Sulfotelmatobacter sp.]|jgi:hypothetical protein
MAAVREISPAVGISADEYVALLPPAMRQLVNEIRRGKQAGERLRPSGSLIDYSALLTRGHRNNLLDAVASLVDENYAGRAEMCLQFADLLNRALMHLHFPSRPVVGTAMYYDFAGKEIFRWTHAWVRIADEVIDGNVDSLAENPIVPNSVCIKPYWGPIARTPSDRRLRENHGESLPSDVDVEQIWWPELRSLLNDNFM